MKKLIIFIVLLFAIINASALWATDWFVDKDATGANNGTSWQDAWQEFGDINWNSIQPGDTIYISGGVTSETYTAPAGSNRILEIKKSGELGAPITIKPGAAHPTLSAGHDGLVILDGKWTAENGIYMNNKQYVTVDGGYNGERKIKVTHTNNIGVEAYGGATGVKFLWIEVNRVGDKDNAHGMYISWGWGAEIAHNIITDAYQDGLRVEGCTNATDYGQGPDIHHNIISNISDDGVAGDGAAMDFHDNVVGPWRDTLGSGHPDGMQMYYAKYSKIYNNTFYDTGDNTNSSNALVFLDVTYPSTAHILIYNNVFYVSGARYYDNRWWGLYISNENASILDDIVVANNTFVDIPWNAIRVTFRDTNQKLSNLIIKNNLLFNTNKMNSSGAAIYLGPANGYTSVIVDNNIIYPGVAGGRAISYDGTWYPSIEEFDNAKGTQNCSCKPAFVSYEPGDCVNADLHLSSTDLCAMGKGSDLSAYFGTDKDGISRPQGSAWCIGAYEYVWGNFYGISISGGISTQ